MTYLNPGETVEMALLRRVKMHEFLMTGGVQTSYVDGRMTYSGPVIVAATPTCPWHIDTDCEAWIEIREGRGHWTRLEAELAAAEAELDTIAADDVGELADRILALTEELSTRPRDAAALRSRTPEQLEAERRSAQLQYIVDGDIVGDAPSPLYRGSQYGSPQYGETPRITPQYGGSRPSPRQRPLTDARDTAIVELAFEPTPDEIIIEGDEEDED